MHRRCRFFLFTATSKKWDPCLFLSKKKRREGKGRREGGRDRRGEGNEEKEVDGKGKTEGGGDRRSA